MKKQPNVCFVRHYGVRILFSLLVFGIVGCGGGGVTTPGGNSGGIPPGGTVQSPDGRTGTALFHVDVRTGQVTVTPLNGSAASRAVFAGTAVNFNSSLLLDQPGDVGIKTLSVSLTNRWGLPIGQTPDGAATGMKVLFSSFTNVGALTTDLRSKTTVSTLAGTTSGYLDGAAAQAMFKSPFGVATDASGSVYVTDLANQRVRKIRNGLVTTLAGSGVLAHVDGAGTAASFADPTGIAINPKDQAMIVAEYTGRYIRRITPDGSVTTVAGNASIGAVDGPGNVASFNAPEGVAVDANGTIYVIETKNHKVRKIVLAPGADPRFASNYQVTTLAGSGTAGFADGVGTGAQFASPQGIAVDTAGILYVADTANARIRRVSPNGEVVTIAGTGVSGSADGTGDVATFGTPEGIVFSNGGLFVTDNNKHKIRQLTLAPGGAPSSASSWRVATLAGTGSSGATNGGGDVATFAFPAMVTADAGGTLLVADRNNNLIRKVSPSTGFLPIGVATGAAPAEPVKLSNPDGLVPVLTNGTYLNFINYDGALAAGATGPAKNWSFVVPSGVTAFEFTVTVEAQTTSLAPPEAVNNGSGGGGGAPTVRVRTLTGGSQGYVDGSLAAARFYQPLSIAIDRAGNLYVGDSNDAIRRIGTNGIVSTIAGSVGTGFTDGYGSVAQFSSPRGIAVNPDGTVIYVADQGNNRVRRIYNINPTGDVTNPDSWYVTTIAGTGATGGTYTSARGNVATFNLPFGIAWGPGDTVYMSELNGNRIRRLRFLGGDPSQSTQWLVTLLAGDISAAGGVTGDVDGTGSAARFNSPLALALDSAGKVYVCDQNNQRIRVITPDGVTSTLAGGMSGDTPAFGYVDGPASSGGVAVARFYFPFGIAVDSSGFVYVADYYNNRIRRISPSGVVTTVAGTSANGSTDGSGDVAQFFNPDNIAVDASGTLYVLDRFNNAIRVVQRVINGP